MSVLRLILGVAAIVLGIFALFSFAPGDLTVTGELGLGVACAGGAALL
jgi:hypothetical protein